MTRRRSIITKTLCIILSTALLSTSVFMPVSAAGNITGTYQYTSNEGSNKQGTDSFVYNDSYFTASSFTENIDLRLLSTQAAIASSSRYGDAEDKYEIDPSGNAKNILNMLNAMGFQNVMANEWYSHEKQEDSFGVAIGSRQIVQGDKTYTLLAIFPRSAGYKQEWVGNFNVGTGEIHAGFKAARDEALRFAKKYIQENNITGDLKVWIAGHSRGAAVSNLIGGFFAGGGIEYFGEKVSITPEDVYCYTFATPKNIKNNAPKNTVLSVAGARITEPYQYDTRQDAYDYTSGGTITINDEMFNGIRNYPFAYDFITYLPPAEWGFSNYGQYCNFGDVTEAQMRSELKKLNRYIYDKYVNGGSPLEFHEKTLDVANLTTKDVEGGLSGQDGMVEFLKARINGFRTTFPTNQKKYVEDDYQVTMQSYIALYGMASGEIKEVEGLTGMLAKPLIMAYLSYASKCMYGENPTVEQENQAAAIALKQLLDIMLEKQPPIDLATYTVDNFFADFTKYVADNEGSELSKKIIDLVESQVPKDYASIAKGALGDYCPGYDSANPDATSLGKIVFSFIKACAYGADPESNIYKTASQRDPVEVRKTLYGLVTMMSMLGVLKSDLATAINSGNGKFTDLVAAILKIFKQDVTNPGSEPTSSEVAPAYATLDAAATGELREALSKIRTQVNTSMTANNRYTSEFRTQVDSHFGQAIACVPKIRECAMNLLFAHDPDSDGDFDEHFDTDYNIKSLATLIGNAGRIPPAHYNEPFVAWAKAAIPKPPSTPSTPSTPDVIVTPKTDPVVTPPQVQEEVKYKGEPVELIAPIESSGGTVYYGLGTPDAKPTKWTTTVPTASEPGTYYVWYKVAGDNKYKSVEPTYIGEPIEVSGMSDNVIVTPPQVREEVKCKGEPVELITPIESSGGTVLYGLGTPTEAPTEWSTTVPTASEPGTYYVWYKVEEDDEYKSIEPTYVGEPIEVLKTSDNVKSVDSETGKAAVYDGVTGTASTVSLEVITEGIIYRMYDPNRGEHFFTKNKEEADHLESLGWRHEERSDFIVIDADDEDAVPVYRMYNPNDGGMHFYTEDPIEAKNLVEHGWDYEGISHYVFQKASDKGVEQLRLYNPNSTAGEHIWTTDIAEWDNLIKAGWKDEGVCWRISR